MTTQTTAPKWFYRLCLLPFLFADALFPFGLKECGQSRACWSFPPECKSPGDCHAIVRWRYTKNKLRVELQAKSIGALNPADEGPQWMAMAFSDDIHMGNDSVLECVFGTEAGNGAAHISYNEGTDNIVLEEASRGMLGEREFFSRDGLFGCAFVVDYGQTPNAEQKMVLRLDGKDWWHVLFAQGTADRKSGHKQFHLLVQKSEQLTRVCEDCSDKFVLLQGILG